MARRKALARGFPMVDHLRYPLGFVEVDRKLREVGIFGGWKWKPSQSDNSPNRRRLNKGTDGGKEAQERRAAGAGGYVQTARTTRIGVLVSAR